MPIRVAVVRICAGIHQRRGRDAGGCTVHPLHQTWLASLKSRFHRGSGLEQKGYGVNLAPRKMQRDALLQVALKSCEKWNRMSWPVNAHTKVEIRQLLNSRNVHRVRWRWEERRLDTVHAVVQRVEVGKECLLDGER